MRIEIVRPDGDLKREFWEFVLLIDWGRGGCIYLNSYSSQYKGKRCRLWRVLKIWRRLDSSDNTIDKPPLPPDVEAEVRKRYQDYILTLPIEF